MITDTQSSSWRAVEALRSGVPNRDAVQVLGNAQPAVEERFLKTLASVQEQFAWETAPEGILTAGDFGSGKSHLLEYLQHLALQANFVCSKVVVSKETPLYDPVKLYAAAVQAAKVPDRKGAALPAIAAKLDFDSAAYQRFYHWVFSEKTGLSARFPASLYVFERGKGDRYPDVSDRIVQFWGGTRLPESELRAWLRELGEVATYQFDKVSARELTLQRYRFISQLMVAAGYAGWVVLVDEVELMGRYSVKQRARAYAEMARLLGLLEEDLKVPGLSVVLAITSAYQSEVMDEKGDEAKIPDALRASGKAEELEMVRAAERGMRKIREIPQENMVLQDAFDVQEVYNKSRAIYSRAYHWEPPQEIESNNTWRIRQHIKRWINEWDLLRLYPGYKPQVQVGELVRSYSEDLDLERANDNDREAAD